MAVIEATINPVLEASNFGQLTVDYLRRWCDLCDQFNECQHQHVIGANLSPAEQENHRQNLKWFLRLTKLMHLAASDPEFPDRSLVELLQTKIWQLEQSWKLLYRTLTREEIESADGVLREVFPDESGA